VRDPLLARPARGAAKSRCARIPFPPPPSPSPLLSPPTPLPPAGPNQAAPGGAAALRVPGAAKPLIAVSGDGDQRAYVLTAAADGDPRDWGYDSQLLWDCKGTVGGVLPLLIGSRPYAFVACYDEGRVEAFAL
jgi:hypothetical protein